MYPRKPLPYADQIDHMKRYLRRLRSELRHRYDEFFEATKGRRECALEVQLRHRILEYTRESVALAEACLQELQRQEVLFYAPFKPGDYVVVDYQEGGAARSLGRYLVIDVCPDKWSGFHYEALAITKAGAIHKRRTKQWLSPREALTIQICKAPVSNETEEEADYYRECAKASRTRAFEKGDLAMFEAVEGYLGGKRFRRSDRMSL
jgi:hypothetical protein